MWMIFRKWQKSRGTREIEKRVAYECGKTDLAESIFVAIYAYRDDRLADTLIDLFDKATCPKRITVGVYQHLQGADHHCIRQYESTAKYYGHPTFSDNIRVLTGPVIQAKGRSWPMAMIMKSLWHNERYCLLLEPGTRLCKDWDNQCIQQLTRAASAMAANSQKTVSTTAATNTTEQTQKGDLSASDDWRRVVITQSPPERNALSLASGVNGQCTYNRFERWKDDKLPLPVRKVMAFKQKPVRPTLTFFCDTSFLFAASDCFFEVPFDARLYFVDKQDLDWLLMLRLWTHGYSVFNPELLLCAKMPSASRRSIIATGAAGQDQTVEANVDRPPPLKAHLRDASYHALYGMIGVAPWPDNANLNDVFGKVRTLASYCTASGIHFDQQKVSDQALLGLWHSRALTFQQQEEIQSKYGSWSDAMHERELMRERWTGSEDHPYGS